MRYLLVLLISLCCFWLVGCSAPLGSGPDPSALSLEPRAPQSGPTPATEPESKFLMAMRRPLSTFSVDVDTASYTNLRRSLELGRRPSPEAIRLEEMLNYFHYDLEEPAEDEVLAVSSEVSECPWDQKSRLMRVALKAREVEEIPARNLVFLLDVSGSMADSDKLPLLKQSMGALLEVLDEKDTVAIVTYAGSSGVALEPTPGNEKEKILRAFSDLDAGGGTHGSAGLELAYEMAEKFQQPGSANRVILGTDGDFNLGVSSLKGLRELIEEKRQSGVYLSVLGFGRSNDQAMENLAHHGNGNYAFIDSLAEARRVLVEEAESTLVTVAKDVKIQVEFDPRQVESYRLLGYDNRRLDDRDFADDQKDAGEVGSGHAVTALYELRLTEGPVEAKLATVRVRYKTLDSEESELREAAVAGRVKELADCSADHQWAVGVVAFGELLRGNLDSAELPPERLTGLLQARLEHGADDYHREFARMVEEKA